MGQASGEQSDLQQVIDIWSSSQSVLDLLTSPVINFPSAVEGPLVELVVPNVWPSDIFRLHQRM